MFFTIYKITNNINNKYYIGKHKTKNINDNYMGSGILIKRAIKKYGIENFNKEILYVFQTEEEMNIKEKELVVVSEETYNMCEGGKGGFSYINSNKELRTKGHTKEMYIKVSNTMKGKYKTIKNYGLLGLSEQQKSLAIKLAHESRIKKYPKGTFKFKQTDEALKKQKEALMKNKHQQGKKNSQYGTFWITNSIENKKIRKEDLDIWLNLGYTRGRKI